MSQSRNVPCPCGSGLKYKKCCLTRDEAQRKPHSCEDAILVLQPTRGQICVETQIAIENNIAPTKYMIVRATRKPVVEARNALAKAALHLQQNNPFDFTPRELFALWIDDDAWFPPAIVPTMLNCLQECPKIDALFASFTGRGTYGQPIAYRRRGDHDSFPRVGVDCKHG